MKQDLGSKIFLLTYHLKKGFPLFDGFFNIAYFVMKYT